MTNTMPDIDRVQFLSTTSTLAISELFLGYFWAISELFPLDF